MAKKRLLVPTNFSRNSELALDFALQLLRTMDADLYVFHVFEEVTNDYRRLDKTTEESLDRMKQIVMQALERARSAGQVPHVDQVHRRMANGKPAREILRMAGGMDADMIIMGSPTTHEFRQLLDEAPCTLVFVRDKDPTYVKP